MRIRAARTSTETPQVAGDNAVITAVDAALGFIAGQRWVRRQLAVSLLEAVRDAARAVDAPKQLHALIDAALEECDEDLILAAPLTDALLDIRNGFRPTQAAIAGGAR